MRKIPGFIFSRGVLFRTRSTHFWTGVYNLQISPGGGMFSSAKKGTMKGRGKRGKREEKSERARGKGKKKGGEGEEKEKKWKKYR